MSLYRPDSFSSSSSSTERDLPEGSKYTLRSLREFLARKKFFIKSQFVGEDGVVFIKVHCESIGEDILIYFPSKFNVPGETGLASIDIVPYDLTDKDLLSLQQTEEKETQENYTELQIDDLKDSGSFADENYKPLSIDSNREYLLRKAMVRYSNQLNKFRNCTVHIKYKFAILTNDTLCVINRYNETECYLIKNTGTPLIQNIIDSKTDSVVPIGHELYVLIDLPSFYEKINTIPDDLIKVHKNFYATLSRAHTKQTALTEHRFKNYQLIVSKMTSEYTRNGKYLEMMASLTKSLEKSVEQEEMLLQKQKIVSQGNEEANKTMSKDTERSFKLSKNEQELSRVREVKAKTSKLLHEIKTRYHSFLITFDSAITETCANLKQVEESMNRLGVKIPEKNGKSRT